MAVHDQDVQCLEGSREHVSVEEEEDDHGCEGRVWQGHDPAVGEEHRAADVHEWQADFQASSLNGKGVDVLLLSFDDLDAQLAAVSAEVPVDGTPDYRTCDYGPAADGEVAEADLDGVVVVDACELGWKPGHDNVEAGVQYTRIEQQQEAFLLEQYWERGQYAWSSFVLYCLLRNRDTVLAQLAKAKIGHQRYVPFLCRHRAISDDITASLGDEDNEYRQHESGEDGQEPED